MLGASVQSDNIGTPTSCEDRRPPAKIPAALLSERNFHSAGAIVWAEYDVLSVRDEGCTKSREKMAADLGMGRSQFDLIRAQLLGGDDPWLGNVQRGRQRTNQHRALRRPVGSDRYVEVPRWIIDLAITKAITAAQWRLFAWVIWRSGPNGECYKTHTELGDELGLHHSTVLRNMKALVAGCLVEATPKAGGGSWYRPITDLNEVAERLAARADLPQNPEAGLPQNPGVSSRKTREPLRGHTQEDTPTEKKTSLVPPVGRLTRVTRDPARPSARDLKIPPPRRPAKTPAEEVHAVVAGIPPALAAIVPSRAWGVIRSRVRAALDEDRTPAELVNRIRSRWLDWGYALDLAVGEKIDPVAVLITLVRRGTCAEPMCEDGYLTALGGDGRECPRCQERREAHFLNQPTTPGGSA